MTPAEVKAMAAASVNAACGSLVSRPSDREFEPMSNEWRALCALAGINPTAVSTIRVDANGDVAFKFRLPLERLSLSFAIPSEPT